jgi:hypothetical protein
MKIKWLIFLSFIIVAFSCRKSISKEEINTVLDSTMTRKLKVTYLEVKLNAKTKKEVEGWTEYQKMNDFIKQYYSISKIDALFNANELSELAQQLKDTIRVEKFKIPSLRIRLNVLYTETLRLADMASINSISEDEIKNENENILNAFSALNLKLNNIIDQEILNEDLSKFIEEVKSTPELVPEENSFQKSNLKKPIKKINK